MVLVSAACPLREMSSFLEALFFHRNHLAPAPSGPLESIVASAQTLLPSWEGKRRWSRSKECSRLGVGDRAICFHVRNSNRAN